MVGGVEPATLYTDIDDLISAERIAGNEMALDVERVLDCGMNGLGTVVLIRAI